MAPSIDPFDAKDGFGDQDLSSLSSDIAIIGVSGRFPGEATSPRNLWDMVVEGRNAREPVPKSRFNANGFWHKDPSRVGTIGGIKQGHFVKQDIRRFDAGFFSITPEEAKAMDPLQRILLETAYEGLENAGLTMDQIADQPIGCFVGGGQSHDYWDLQALDLDSIPKYSATGLGTSILSNRISWFFNLRGPSMTIDTACSSSMTAMHMACQSIRSGETDSCLVGGFNLRLLPVFDIFATPMSFLSKDDKCHSFDTSANGYARGEGGGFVVLKRMDLALRDGDTIRAVVRATGANQDGRTLGLTQPSAVRQADLIRQTYESAGLPLHETNYFEAHGTGTAAGDPVECSAIGAAFSSTRQRPFGIVGMVKAVYSLESGWMAPTHGLTNINPKIKLAEWKIDIPTRATRWPAGLRRISINNFGYGGANAHVNHNLKAPHNTTVEELLTNSIKGPTTIPEGPTSRLFLLSSHEESGITRLSESLQKYLGEVDTKNWSEEQNRLLHRLAYTLSEKRSSLPWKTFAAASTIEELQQALDGARTQATRTPTKARPLTFIFTGQGAQWYGMGRSLQKYPVFQKSLHESNAHLKSFGCTWDLLVELNRSAEESQIDLPDISQAACTALQLGIVDLLASWGIRPQVVIGHSSGEIAAGYSKGAFDKAAGMRIAYYRGLLTSQLSKNGAMAAVGLGQEAAQNPESTTLSGDVEGVNEVMHLLQADDVFARKLRVLTAYHSHHMQLIAEKYLAGMEEGAWKPKSGHKDITMVSSVKGKPIDGTELVPSYYVANLISAVNFSGAVTAAAEAGLLGGKSRNQNGIRGSPYAMVEIGPHAALQGPLKQIMTSRKQDAIQTSLEVAGELFVLGHLVDMRLANAYGSYRSVDHGDVTDDGKISPLVELPTYAWNTSKKYWSESAAISAYRNRSHARLELLGARDERSTELEPSWRNLLRTSEQPWIEHHQFQSTNIYPMAGMIVMAIEGMRQIQTRNDIEGFQVRDVNIGKALVVPINQTIETRLQLAPWRSSPIANEDSSYWTEFKVSSRNESGTWTANCNGLIKANYTSEGDSATGNGVFVNEEAAANAQLQVEYKEIRQGDFPSLEPAVFYDKLDSAGFHLGPAFQGVKKLNLLNDKSHYTVEVEDTKHAWYGEDFTARMPVSTASIYVSAKFDSTPGTKYHGFSRTYKLGGGGDKMASDVFAFGEDGDDKPVIALRGCEHVPLRGSGAQSDVSGGASGSLGGHVPIAPRLAPDVTMIDAAQIQQILQDGPNLATSLGKYVTLLAHKYPALDILESNSSANSLLTRVLLGGGEEIRKRVKSVILSGVVAAEEQSGPWKQLIHHQQLNLAEDPVEQGFEEASRDLVVLDTAQTYESDNAVILANIKKLLKPWGVLLVANGPDNTVIPEEVLVSAGFTAPTSINISDASRLTIASVTQQSNAAVQNILIVMPQSPSPKVSRAVEQVERELKQVHNYNVVKLPFDAATPEQLSSYLALFALDLDIPFLEDLDEESFVKLRSLILGTQGTLWLTLDTASGGLVKGLGRTIRGEYPEIPFSTLSLDSAAPFDADVNVRTISQLISTTKRLDQSTDSEYVIRNGQVLVERLEPQTDLKTLLDAAQSGQSLPTVTMPLKDRGDETLRLSFREPGLLDSFEYHLVPGLTALDPVAEGQMEIEVRSVGLNSRDVMMATGQDEDTNIGMECAGIVFRLGPGVTKFRVGDRVFGLHGGCFQTRLRVDPRTFAHTPDSITDEVAGSLMGQYQTAVQSLINVGRLQRDESVLIHSAAGGVGQAAIIVAQYLGSKKIFCTVSSEKKKKFLMAEYGIPEAHIFNSRDHSFADGVMRLTNGQGVDVVLNSLANEALRRTWNCVAPFGRFIELGKRDIHDNTGLEMRPFLNNISFSGLDINTLVTEYPDKCEKLSLQVLELLEQGVIRPLKNITQYSFGQVEQAFQLMQSGDNIGKVVLIPRPDDVVPVIPGGLGAFRLSSNSTYVLIGGLGGIGRSIAQMLADKGAKHFVFLSRSGNTRPEAQALLDKLQGQGVTSIVTAVDVADKAQLEAALNKVKQSCPPIKGMINCAMDLKDGIYNNMTAKDWNLSLRPKLKATRNLHELLPADLDFFVCLSSIAGIIGNRGQANYNAGNNYQDALMHHRATSGLAATSLNLSLVVGVGVSTEQENVFQLLKNGDLIPQNETDVLNLVAAAVSGRAPTQVAIGTATGGQLDKSSSNDPYWFDDSRFAILSRLDRHSGGDNNGQATKEDWKKLVATATSKDQVHDLVLDALVAGLSNILKVEQDDIDSRKSLPALGIDSLVAIEIRNWLRKEFQADLSVFDIVSNDPLSTFAPKVAAKSAVVPAGLA
ncbi:hypothetical protein LI328DRAFT_168866 [Trichoderma asperelloides]|nr:hypothetical protein LI328DRAFT_168866 [Trichoderma asperelloides]